jgi:hypothetical protein
MRNPQIEELDLAGYSGKADEEIMVTVSKKGFEIQEVEVVVVDQGGEVIEEGKAEKGLGTNWIYKTSSNMDEKEKAGFVIRVRDRTGNIKEKTF